MSDIRYDYENQAWIVNGRYVRCGHVSPCGCYGKLHEGEQAMKTIWESDGTDGPVLICFPPTKEVQS